MLKKLINLFLLLIFSVTLMSCANIKTIKNYYAPKNITISSMQIDRLSNYLKGEFYSYEIDRYTFAYPITFLISEDGTKSVILACDGFDNACNVSTQIYQLIQKFNKKENTSFKILALEKDLKIMDEEILKKIKVNKFKKLPRQSSIYFDKILIPADSCDGEDC